MSANKPISERVYDFSDAVLEQFADITAANLTRDMATLASRGITPATVTALEELREDLTNSPSDIEERALVGEASETKEAARDSALINTRRLRTAAQNVFGEDSSKYRRFGFTGMDKLGDDELRNAFFRFHRVGVIVQAQLADEGIDAAFLTEFLNSINAYASALGNVQITEETRDAQTEDRVSKGNALYKEVVRVCNIGKDVFAPISEATYNDYVIENYVGNSAAGLAATSLEIKGKVTIEATSTPVVNATVMLNDIDTSRLKIKATAGFAITTTDEQGRYSFLLKDLPPHVTGFILMTLDVPGFQHFERVIEVTTGESFTVDVALAVGLMKAA